MTTQLRHGIADCQPPVTLSGEVECDEVYVVAGHKGRPEAVKKARSGRLIPLQQCFQQRAQIVLRQIDGVAAATGIVERIGDQAVDVRVVNA